MTGGSEKFMEKSDGFYFGEFKNLVCMVHTNEKNRVATISEVSATSRAQSKQTEMPKARLPLATNSVQAHDFLFPTKFYRLVSLLGKRTSSFTFINRIT